MPSTSMPTTDFARAMAVLGFQGDAEALEASGFAKVREVLLDLFRSCPTAFDLSDLSGDATPVTLHDFLVDNEDSWVHPSELLDLVTCEIGGTVYLGIGGGAVLVRRVNDSELTPAAVSTICPKCFLRTDTVLGCRCKLSGTPSGA